MNVQNSFSDFVTAHNVEKYGAPLPCGAGPSQRRCATHVTGGSVGLSHWGVGGVCTHCWPIYFQCHGSMERFGCTMLRGYGGGDRPCIRLLHNVYWVSVRSSVPGPTVLALSTGQQRHIIKASQQFFWRWRWQPRVPWALCVLALSVLLVWRGIRLRRFSME